MMQYKGYAGTVEYDADAKLLHGEVIGIRDVVTFQGRSVAEVERAFRKSVDDYLEFCKKRGEEPDKPYSGQFVVRVDPQLHRQASAAAQAQGKSLNTFVRDTLATAIDAKSTHSTEHKKRRTRGAANRRRTA